VYREIEKTVEKPVYIEKLTEVIKYVDRPVISEIVH